MKNWRKLMIETVVIFTILMLGSGLGETDMMRNLFGDFRCEYVEVSTRYGSVSGCDYPQHKTTVWHWGWRHWLYTFMGVILFIIQVVRIIYWLATGKSDFEHKKDKDE